MSLRPSSDEQFAASVAGSLPGVVELRDDTWAIAIPLPVAAPPYTLTYVLTDAAGDLHLVDPGWDAPGNLELLDHSLHSIGASLERVATVTATHMHADHLGLAERIRSASGARVAVHSAEQRAIDAGPDVAPNFVEWGVPPELHEQFTALVGRARPGATADVLLEHGQLLDIPGREVSVIHTPGHTVGHLSLWEPAQELLFTGDLLLPTIFPGIGLGGASPDPIADYLASLDAIEALGDPEVCPGHGYGFHGLGERCAVTRAHQLGRTHEVDQIVAAHPEATVWEVASHVTWTGGWAGLHGLHLASALSQTAMRMRHVSGARLEP